MQLDETDRSRLVEMCLSQVSTNLTPADIVKLAGEAYSHQELKLSLYTLPERATGSSMADVETVDLREELVRGAIRSILNGGPGGDGLTERMEKLNREIREKLGEAGLPEDYLAPVYNCPLCRDTGYTGEVVRERCRCMIQAYQRKLRQQIGLDGGREETFENFNSVPDNVFVG